MSGSYDHATSVEQMLAISLALSSYFGPNNRVTARVEAALLLDESVVIFEDEDEGAEVKMKARINGVFEGVDADGNWIISGTTVTVDQTTDTDGLPPEGQRVKVEAFFQDDGSLLAREIRSVTSGVK